MAVRYYRHGERERDWQHLSRGGFLHKAACIVQGQVSLPFVLRRMQERRKITETESICSWEEDSLVCPHLPTL